MHGTVTKFSSKCAECGHEFQAKRADRAEYCSTECRSRYNNRRRDRGAMLYDLYVHSRFNRKAATAKNLLTLIDRMVGNWVEEDRQAGRRVMRDLDDVMQAAMPHTNVRCDIKAGR